WPTNVPLIQPGHGGVDRKAFWMPLHAALTLALPAALWACWPRAAARRWLLVALGAYVVMRAWTLLYFVPAALPFDAEGLSAAWKGRGGYWGARSACPWCSRPPRRSGRPAAAWGARGRRSRRTARRVTRACRWRGFSPAGTPGTPRRTWRSFASWR